MKRQPGETVRNTVVEVKLRTSKYNIELLDHYIQLLVETRSFSETDKVQET